MPLSYVRMCGMRHGKYIFFFMKKKRDFFTEMDDKHKMQDMLRLPC